MLDANSQRDKVTSIEGGNSAADQEKMDSYNTSSIPDHNQDPRNMSTRSLDYESVVLNSPNCGNYFKFYLFNFRVINIKLIIFSGV